MPFVRHIQNIAIGKYALVYPETSPDRVHDMRDLEPYPSEETRGDEESQEPGPFTAPSTRSMRGRILN